MAHLRVIKQGLHHSALSPEPSPSPSSSQSSSPTAFARHQRTTPAAPCASPERMQGILRAALDAPLPLEVEGRTLPGHGDAQVCEEALVPKQCSQFVCYPNISMMAPYSFTCWLVCGATLYVRRVTTPQVSQVPASSFTETARDITVPN